MKVCRLGLLAHPTEVEGRLILGEALLALSRYDEVLAEMRVALELDSDNPRALGLKGASLLRKGDVLQACDVLARAVTATPGDTTLRQLYTEARTLREGMMQPSGYGTGAGYRPSDSRSRSGLLPQGGASGDQSGTIEIDPDMEGVELVSGSIRTPPHGNDQSEPSIELSAADIMPGGLGAMSTGFDVIDGPFAPRPSARIPPLEAPVDRQLTGPSPRLARPAGYPAGGPAAGPAAARRMSGHEPPITSAQHASIDEMFPEEERGVSRMDLNRLERPPGPERPPGMHGGPAYGNGAGGPPGMGHPGMGHPGMGQPGMGQPGMGHPGMGPQGMGPQGMGPPGMAQPGMGGPGMGPGAGHPGAGHPGAGHPGAGHPGAGHPGAGHPGAAIQASRARAIQAWRSRAIPACEGLPGPACPVTAGRLRGQRTDRDPARSPPRSAAPGDRSRSPPATRRRAPASARAPTTCG